MAKFGRLQNLVLQIKSKFPIEIKRELKYIYIYIYIYCCKGNNSSNWSKKMIKINIPLLEIFLNEWDKLLKIKKQNSLN